MEALSGGGKEAAIIRAHVRAWHAGWDDITKV
jgi:hypothetical protein